MNSYSSLRKKNSGSLLAVVALALCVVLSGTVLFSRLQVYAASENHHDIPLTRSGGATRVTVGQRDENGGIRYEPAVFQPGSPLLLAATPDFKVYDDNTVWQGQTDVEIFRVSYDNASGQISVTSENDAKLLAPGTSNEYKFRLDNTGNVALDYSLTMEAYFSDNAHPIPVSARVVDHQGNYLIGSASEKVDVLELSKVSQSGTVAAGCVMPYTLEWEWPFEGDDEYDTMLGNLAVEKDISLTVVIRTMASYSADPDTGDGIPKTGDTSNILLLSCMMVVSLAGLLFLLLPRSKREEQDE